jgi:plastocyanin
MTTSMGPSLVPTAGRPLAVLVLLAGVLLFGVLIFGGCGDPAPSRPARPVGETSAHGDGGSGDANAGAGGGARTADAGAAATTGALRGVVSYVGPPVEPAPIRIVKDVAVCSKIKHVDERLKLGKGNGIIDAVVSVVRNGDAATATSGAGGTRAAQALTAEFRPDTFTMDQRDCRYEPHIMIVPTGSTVTFLNSDKILHNVHSFCEANVPKNIAQPAMVPEIRMTFEKPERVRLRCDIHGWMSAWVIVTGNPRSILTGREGEFSFAGLEPGEYTVTCWQEQFGEKTVTVRLEAGQAADVKFEYGGMERATSEGPDAKATGSPGRR